MGQKCQRRHEPAFVVCSCVSFDAILGCFAFVLFFFSIDNERTNNYMAVQGAAQTGRKKKRFFFTINTKGTKRRLQMLVGWLKCCFTSTETVGLLGTEAHDVHLDFHTAPEL